MKEKNSIKENLSNKKPSSDIILIVEKKCEFFREIIQKTLINVQKNIVFWSMYCKIHFLK